MIQSLTKLFLVRYVIVKKKFVLVGVDVFGKNLLSVFGRENIAYFCDDRYQGQLIDGIEVISPAELRDIHPAYDVIVSLSGQIFAQTLRQSGVPFTFVFGSVRFFNLWKNLFDLALKGMNIGGGSNVFSSGEWMTLQLIKNNLQAKYMNPPLCISSDFV